MFCEVQRFWFLLEEGILEIHELKSMAYRTFTLTVTPF